MNIVWTINLFNFKQKRNKDTTSADCVVVRKIPNQALIGSYYNGLIHQKYEKWFTNAQSFYFLVL